MKYIKIAMAVLGCAGWMLQAQPCQAQGGGTFPAEQMESSSITRGNVKPFHVKKLSAQDSATLFSVRIEMQDSSLGRILVSQDTVYQYVDSVPSGDTITFSIIPDQNQKCFSFAQWSDGDTTKNRKVCITCDTVIIALFEPKKDTITVGVQNDSIGGYIHIDNNKTKRKHINAIVECGYHISAVNDPYSQFVMWSDSVTDNPRIYNADFTRINAIFAPKDKKLMVKTQNGNGKGSVAIWRKKNMVNTYERIDTISSDTILSLYMGDSIRAIARPYSDFVFRCWNNNFTGDTIAFQLDSDTSITVLAPRFDSRKEDVKVVKFLDHLLVIDVKDLRSKKHVINSNMVYWYMVKGIADFNAFDENNDSIVKQNSFSFSLPTTLPKDSSYVEYYGVVLAKDSADVTDSIHKTYVTDTLHTKVFGIGKRIQNPSHPTKPSKQDSITYWHEDMKIKFQELCQYIDSNDFKATAHFYNNPTDSSRIKSNIIGYGEESDWAPQRSSVMLIPNIVPIGQEMILKGLSDDKTYTIRIFDIFGRMMRQYAIKGEESASITAEQIIGTYTVCVDDGCHRTVFHYVTKY